mgnify:CR=1 FL=1
MITSQKKAELPEGAFVAYQFDKKGAVSEQISSFLARYREKTGHKALYALIHHSQMSSESILGEELRVRCSVMQPNDIWLTHRESDWATWGVPDPKLLTTSVAQHAFEIKELRDKKQELFEKIEQKREKRKLKQLIQKATQPSEGAAAEEISLKISVPRSCVVCGTEFWTVNSDVGGYVPRKTCSSGCSAKLRWLNRKAKDGHQSSSV